MDPYICILLQAGSYPVSMHSSNVWGLDNCDGVVEFNLPDSGTATTIAPKIWVKAADGERESSIAILKDLYPHKIVKSRWKILK